MKKSIILIIALVILCIDLSPAQSVWPQPPEVKVPLASQPPLLRAEAHDPAWDKAVVLSPLTLGFGCVAHSPLPATTIRVMWSPQALYIRYEAEDSAVVVPYSDRDADHFKGDVVEVFLDPSGKQRVWYEIEVTPHNGIYDAIHLCTTEPKSGPDGVLDADVIQHNTWSFKEWNCAGLQTAARETKNGWIIELAIPAEVLRSTGATLFTPGPLRANFLRYDVDNATPPNRLLLNWSQVVVGRPHRSPARMGTLHLVP